MLSQRDEKLWDINLNPQKSKNLFNPSYTLKPITCQELVGYLLVGCLHSGNNNEGHYITVDFLFLM